MKLNKLDREGRTRSSTDVDQAMVDPGFPREITNPEGSGVQPIIRPNFPRKLHENEETGLRLGAHPLRPPHLLDPALMYIGSYLSRDSLASYSSIPEKMSAMADPVHWSDAILDPPLLYVSVGGRVSQLSLNSDYSHLTCQLWLTIFFVLCLY